MIVNRNQEQLVSVIIPVYNRFSTLLRAIVSVLQQTYNNLEIIVVDDGSDFEMEQLLKKIFEEKVIFYRNEFHKNANVARNRGIECAKGEYIAMLDSDDEWLPDHIEKSVQHLKESDGDCVYGSVFVRYSTHEQKVTARPLRENETMIDYLLSHRYGAQASSLVMTTSSVRKILWDTELNRHQDLDFLVRYSKKFKLVVLTEPTLIYHVTVQNYRIDFNSCIRFLKRNRKDISPDVHNEYHTRMYYWVKEREEDKEIVRFFQKEAVRYKRYVSYRQYRQLLVAHSCWQRIICLWVYAWGVWVETKRYQ